MSAISEKIRAALYGKLNVSGVTGTGLATGGVHHLKAKTNAAYPLVIFNRQAPGETIWALGSNLTGETDLWLIKALVDEDSSTTQSPDKVCANILAGCETAIGTSLSLSGNTTRMVRRFADIPDYIEDLNDRTIYHAGFLLRIFTE